MERSGSERSERVSECCVVERIGVTAWVERSVAERSGVERSE